MNNEFDSKEEQEQNELSNQETQQPIEQSTSEEETMIEQEESTEEQLQDLKEQYEMLEDSIREEKSRKTYYTLVICMILVLATILFASFSYYRVYRSGNVKKNLELNVENETGDKDPDSSQINTIDTYTIKYDSNGATYNINDIRPGWSSGEAQTFSIENSGSYAIGYDILWTNITNTLEHPENLVYTISRNGTVIKSNVELPTKEEYMLKDETVGPNEKNTYVLSYQFVDNGQDQSVDRGKNFSANFEITNAEFK